MHLFKKLLLFATGCLLFSGSFAQNDSCNLKISLLTCSPGEDLYTVFGHSGLRVIDRAAQTDVVYNYGTFDFDEDFYVNFTLGKLLYSLSEQKFEDFMYEYQVEKRSVIEQDLLLTCEEKNILYGALQTNALPPHRYYQYEFLFDNCSTRPRDMVKKNTADSVLFKRIIPEQAPTFRDMLHDYLENGGQFWSEFGIDLLLASKIDRAVKNEEAMFLPDYLMKGFDSAVIRNAPLVGRKRTIIPAADKPEEAFTVTPMMVTVALLIVGAIVTFSKKTRTKNVFDRIFFSVLGLMGCVMLFMWFGTEHELCGNNYNILWALPTHIFIVFFLRQQKTFVKYYFGVAAVICLIILITWPFFPQGLNAAFFPLILLSALRSGSRAIKK